jgi:hypothetical protein
MTSMPTTMTTAEFVAGRAARIASRSTPEGKAKILADTLAENTRRNILALNNHAHAMRQRNGLDARTAWFCSAKVSR